MSTNNTPQNQDFSDEAEVPETLAESTVNCALLDHNAHLIHQFGGVQIAFQDEEDFKRFVNNLIGVDGAYAGAFYALGKLLNLPAQSRSPSEVWTDIMLPQLRKLLNLCEDEGCPQQPTDHVCTTQAAEDDAAVDRFATSMKTKLAEARARGRRGWEDPDEVSRERLSDMLRQHVLKGDPVDVGNFAMFLAQRGESIANPTTSAEDIIFALEHAITGLEWYHSTYPETVDDADEEAIKFLTDSVMAVPSLTFISNPITNKWWFEQGKAVERRFPREMTFKEINEVVRQISTIVYSTAYPSDPKINESLTLLIRRLASKGETS